MFLTIAKESFILGICEGCITQYFACAGSLSEFSFLFVVFIRAPKMCTGYMGSFMYVSPSLLVIEIVPVLWKWRLSV